MSNLQYRQSKIQEKRKQTQWRDFVMEICSWMPVNFYRINGMISRFPDTGRQGNVVSIKGYGTSTPCEGECNEDFLKSVEDLFKANPKMILQQWFENENSDYAELYAGKNCYLSFGVGQHAENILYTTNSHTNIRNVFNSFCVITNCDNIYCSKVITQSYQVFYSSNIHNSNNIWFSSNLLGCSECVACYDLQNQSYCINNQQYSQEEYELKKNKLLEQKDLFESFRQQSFDRVLDNKVCSDVIGQGMINCHDVVHGYFSKGIQNGSNVYIGGGEQGGSHFYDSFDAGNQQDEHLYATHYTGETSSHVYCVSGGANLNNVYYSYHLESCSFCLGCIGLKNKSYCILNKQYTKEEWYEKVDEIFSQMDKTPSNSPLSRGGSQLGEFFPASMNPFYFNDTAAYLIDPSFTKKEVTAAGYLWRDEPIKVDIPEGAEVVKTEDLDKFEKWLPSGEGGVGGGLWTIDKEILKKIIQDEQGNVYRIVAMEYDFLMKYGLPLPRKHWLDRMRENFRIM